MIKKSEKFIILHFIIFSTFKMFIILRFIIFLTNLEIFIIFILSYFKYDNIVFAVDFGKKIVQHFWSAQFIIKYTDLVSHKEQHFKCPVLLGCSPLQSYNIILKSEFKSALTTAQVMKLPMYHPRSS